MSINELKVLIEEYSKNEPSIPFIVKLFRILNEEKKKRKTRKEILELIEKFTPLLNIPKMYSLYLLELYILNYNKDGKYSNLTKENIIDPRKMSGKWTPNTKASAYTIAQMPFRGSNLEGYWTKDRNGVPYYEVSSYGWYPIYIYKDNKWYESVKSYSSSTSRQMSNANPVSWNDFLDNVVYTLTQDEMKMLKYGYSHEDIMKKKLEKLKSIEPEISKRKKTAKTYSLGGLNVNFKVKSVDIDGDNATVTVDIYDVLDRKDGKGVPMTQNYLKGEIPNLTPKMVEDWIKIKLRNELKDYIGTRFSYTEEPPKTQVEFRFNHLKK